MGIASLLVVFACLGVVVYWYAINEEGSADGELGLFALEGVSGVSAGVFGAKYVMKERATSERASSLEEARRFANAAGTFDADSEARLARAQSHAYYVKSRGRRASLRDLYAAEASDAVTVRDTARSTSAGYRRVEGPRYKRVAGEGPRSKYVRADAV